MKYPFRNLFFENYNFMKYLIDKDFRWIAITKVISKEDNEHSSEICVGNSAFFKDWLKETQKAVLGNINEKKPVS